MSQDPPPPSVHGDYLRRLAAEEADKVRVFRNFGYYAAANKIDERRKNLETRARVADRMAAENNPTNGS